MSVRNYNLYIKDKDGIKIMTYQEACKAAKANKGTFYTYDAGNAKIGGTYWCKVRNRIVNQWSNDGKVWY